MFQGKLKKPNLEKLKKKSKGRKTIFRSLNPSYIWYSIHDIAQMYKEFS